MRHKLNAVLLMRTGLAGLAIVALSASLAPAAYGPRTTIGKNYQQTSSTTSTNGIDSGSCITSTNSCYVLFKKAPQGKALIVQHVSCSVEVGGDLRVGSLLSRKGQTFPLRHTTLVPVETNGAYWLVNGTVMHLLKSGERAVVRFINSTTSVWIVECSISGKLK